MKFQITEKEGPEKQRPPPAYSREPCDCLLDGLNLATQPMGLDTLFRILNDVRKDGIDKFPGEQAGVRGSVESQCPFTNIRLLRSLKDLNTHLAGPGWMKRLDSR